MTTKFPAEIDQFENPRPDTSQATARTHSQQHGDANDAIEAVQRKVGADGSTDETSIDYRIRTLQGVTETLGTAAFEPAGAFATSLQGQLADSSVQPQQLAASQSTLNQRIDDVDASLSARMENVEAGQSTSAIYADTLAALQAIAGSFDGQGAFVLNGAGAGQYRWTASGAQWQFLRADMLAQKADKSAVEAVAGKFGPTVRDEPLEVWTDGSENVCFALYGSGTAGFLATRVGNHLVAKGPNGEAVATGKLNVEDVYTQFQSDVSAQFPGAMMIDIDAFGRVGKITYNDGREVFPGGSVLTPASFALMPNGVSGANPSGGFTCTGLALITTGPWTNCWLVANDGRTIEGSTAYLCSIVILAPDFSRVLREFTVYDKFSPVGSLQGVAWDESDNTFWFADQGSNLVRHMDLTGALLPDTINTGFIPNAVARLAAEDALILPRYNTGSVDVFSCSTGLRIRTVTGIRPDHDQAHYVPETDSLWYTAGANGADGAVYVASMATGAQQRQYTLQGSQAIEGIHVKGQQMTVLNDGGFHTVAKPPLSMACRYTINY